MTENHFFGLGAVSLLYDGGLSRIYSRNFFISDVGMVGEIFRVGLFYAAFVYAYAATALQSQGIAMVDFRSAREKQSQKAEFERILLESERHSD